MTQQSWECAEARISLGVYVLGAIDPAERALVDAHLATCRECRDELAGLASLPALLARVSPEELGRIEAGAASQPAQAEAPPELISTVLDLAAARRRKAWWRYAAAAAAIVGLVGGVLGGVAAVSSPGAATAAGGAPTQFWGGCQPEHHQAVSHVTGASAQVSYCDLRWGTGIAVAVSGIPVNTICDLFVTMKDGRSVWAADWTTSYAEGTDGYTASLAEHKEQIASFVIKAGNKTLVTVPA